MAKAIIGIEGASTFLRITDLTLELDGEITPVTDQTAGVTVTYQIVDRAGAELATGPLASTGTPPDERWEAEITLPAAQEITVKWEAVRGTSVGRWMQRGVVEGFY